MQNEQSVIFFFWFLVLGSLLLYSYFMRIVQNFTSIQLDFNPADKRMPLKFDHLENKKIQSMYLMASIPDVTIKSPYNETDITDMGILGTEDFYLNFIDIKGNEAVKNLCFNNGYFMFNASQNDFIEYNIDRLIDIYKSYVQYMITTGNHIRTLLLLAFYQTENYQPFSDEVNGSVSFDITPTADYEDILLKDIVENKLAGKKIKRIIADHTVMPLLSYLDLYTYSGKRIENIPTCLLNERGQKVIYFDYLDIDFSKSYFRQRGAHSMEDIETEEILKTTITLTFIY